jgi:hypothetical protein
MTTNTVGEINPTVESVFSRSRSPVQAFRFSSTVAESRPAHPSIPIFDDIEYCRDEGGEKLAEDVEEETTNDGRKGIEDLERELSFLRSQVARDSVEQTRAGSNYLLENETEVRVQAKQEIFTITNLPIRMCLKWSRSVFARAGNPRRC